MIEHKTIALDRAAIKAEGDGPGRIEGYASVFGGVDSYGDTIVPGAYIDTIPEFIFRGFLAHEHNWAEQIGTIAEAKEDGHGLWLAADFYPDPDSQKIRQRVMSRVERSKFVGLSIGYEAQGFEFRAPLAGETLPPYVDRVRMLKRIKLYEVSDVSVPADAAAHVQTVKGFTLPFDRHSDDVRVAVDEWLERCKSGSELRVKEGRAISAARRTRMATVSGSLREAADDIDAMLEETAPKAAQPGTDRLRFDHDRLRARLARDLGVPA